MKAANSRVRTSRFKLLVAAGVGLAIGYFLHPVHGTERRNRLTHRLGHGLIAGLDAVRREAEADRADGAESTRTPSRRRFLVVHTPPAELARGVQQ